MDYSYKLHQWDGRAFGREELGDFWAPWTYDSLFIDVRGYRLYHVTTLIEDELELRGSEETSVQGDLSEDSGIP